MNYFLDYIQLIIDCQLNIIKEMIERIRKSEDKNLTYTFNIIPNSIAEDYFDEKDRPIFYYKEFRALI